MGVTGLLPQLKEIQKPVSLEKYRGKTLAVDTYGWLHKAIVSCAQELCQDKPTQKYITSVMKKVHMLRHFGVEPYMVFDGASLPTKAATAAERRVKREEAQRKADEYVAKGNRSLAWKEFMKAAAVTSAMAKSIMAELDRNHVKYVVAPYEADPQMVYLEKIGLVDGIISEDSDLLVFGCQRLITKLNDFGECIEINRNEFGVLKSLPGLNDFTASQLRLLAMLSGCDYTKGVPGVGLKTAFNLIKKYNSADRVLMALRAEGKKVPDTFEEELVKADLAFQYQKVFDPRAQALATLNDYPSEFEFEMEYVESCCGVTLESKLHVGVCNGKLDPRTHEFLVSREQNLAFLKSGSVTQGSKSSTVKYQTPKLKTGSIDSFFSAKKVVNKQETEVKKTSVFTTATRKSTSVKNTFTADISDPKVSPMHKRTKKLLDLPAETPKLTGKFSKFFKTPPSASIQTPKSTTFGSDEITGDSDITEPSSPFAHVKSSQVQPVDTTNILDTLTDNDEDLDSNDSFATARGNSESNTSATAEKLDEFDLEQDDEIEESPVKPQTSGSASDHQKVRKLLWDNFSFDPQSAKKFSLPPTFRNVERQKQISDSLCLTTSTSSLSSASSIDLKSDDFNSFKDTKISTSDEFKENSFPSKQVKKPLNRTLAKFAYKP